MDNAGDDQNGAALPPDGQPLDQPGLGVPQDGGEDGENVDQFYDDGGETFLPADHVSISLKYRSFKSLSLPPSRIHVELCDLSEK